MGEELDPINLLKLSEGVLTDMADPLRDHSLYGRQQDLRESLFKMAAYGVVCFQQKWRQICKQTLVHQKKG